MKPTFIAFACVLGPPAFGDAVVLALSAGRGHVAISHHGVDWWKVEERSCFFQASKSIACGTITKVQAKGAVVRLDKPSYQIRVGDAVKKAFGRGPASTTGAISDSEDALILNRSQFATRPRGLFNLTVGLAGGSGYFFPQVQLQMGVGRHLSLGLGTLFYSASAGDASRAASTQAATPRTSLSGLGALATVTGHFSSRYAGFNITAGAGMVKTSFTSTDGLNATTVAGKTEPILLLTSGLRFVWANSLNLGVAAGITRTVMPTTTTPQGLETGIQPLLLVDVGFNF